MKGQRSNETCLTTAIQALHLPYLGSQVSQDTASPSRRNVSLTTVRAILNLHTHTCQNVRKITVLTRMSLRSGLKACDKGRRVAGNMVLWCTQGDRALGLWHSSHERRILSGGEPVRHDCVQGHIAHNTGARESQSANFAAQAHCMPSTTPKTDAGCCLPSLRNHKHDMQTLQPCASMFTGSTQDGARNGPDQEIDKPETTVAVTDKCW